MATKVWSGGAGDRNWGTAGNWAGGVAPVDGDDVIVSDNETNYTPIVIDAGLTPDTGDLDLATLTIQGNVTIGSSSTALTVSVTDGSDPKLTVNTTSPYVKITAGTSGITKAVVSNTGNGTFSLAGGTTTTLEVAEQAMVRIEAAAVVTNIKIAGGTAFAAAGTAFTTSENHGGRLDSERNLGTLRTSGSGNAWTIARKAATLTAGHIYPGARVSWNSSGTISDVTIYTGGVIDDVGSVRDFTVSAATVYSGGLFFPMARVRITKPATIASVGRAVYVA